MLKYITLFAALSAAVLAQDSLMDDLLEQEMQLPCTPKPCFPVCKPVTKNLNYGGYSIPYTENVCSPDTACEKSNAACVATLTKLMKEAEAAEKVMNTKYSAAQVAKGNKATKDAAKAAAAKEQTAAKKAMDLAKAQFQASEKVAATNAAAAKNAAAASAKAQAKMKADLKKYETTKSGHLKAVATYEGASAEAAKAAAAYEKALKEHCDAEAQHAAAVQRIDHPQLAQKKCMKPTGGGAACPSTGSGWKLVRHVPAGNRWHPATDQLTGTDVYGAKGDAKSSKAWSIKFSGDKFSEFLFSTGDCKKWLIAKKSQVIGWYANGKRQIVKSSTSSKPYTAAWYRRRGAREDPWISLTDHHPAIGQGNIVYGENNFGSTHAAAVLPKHGGANVYIR